MFALENEHLKLVCTPKGAQMQSLVNKANGQEILYQGDQGWKDQNPSLFPVIGSTWSGSYTIDGREYAMKNHGLARYAVMEGSRDGNVLAFSFSDDEKTRAQYPFSFRFTIEYRLEGREVKIGYRIENTGDEEMPFTLGLHPAFATDPFENCELKFEPAGQAVMFHTFEDGRPVEYESVQLDTLQLAVWTHPQDSEFVCIEPWYGHADLEKLDVPFERREGTMMLKPGDTWTTGYSIEVK